MIMHVEPGSFIYFGDASDKLNSKEYLTWNNGDLLERKPFVLLSKQLQLRNLSFLHQIHSNHGVMVDNNHTITPFFIDGDYLITNEPGFGIGVMTADCLPVICYDARTQSIGVAHAGWRGAVDGVVITMLNHMKEAYGIDPTTIKIFLGPSAKVCCYQVAPDFGKNLESYPFGYQMIRACRDKYFFDLSGFVTQQLVRWGVPVTSLHMGYNRCTICIPSFCSYRRYCTQGSDDTSGRQMTVACIK